MERLTIPDEKIPGGTRRKFISVKAVKEEAMTLYWQLKKYEDIGLTPEQIRELDRLYLEKCLEVTALKKQQRWIPVEKRLPKEKDGHVLVCCKGGEINTGIHSEFSGDWYIGDMCSIGGSGVLAWMPLPEPYRPAD